MDRNIVRQLCQAASEGDKELVEKLLDAAVVDGVNEQGDTPLYLAAINGHAHILQMLLRGGATINKSVFEETALDKASQHGHVDCLEILLQEGGRAHSILTEDAVRNGHASCLKKLLEYGTDCCFEYCLLEAARAGQIECLQVLLQALDQHDAYEKTKSKQSILNQVYGEDPGDTILKAAVGSNRKDAVLLLLRNGAEIELSDRMGRTPLLKATCSGFADIVSLLLGHGASIHATSVDGVYALWAAARKGHTHCFDLIVSQDGVVYDKPDKYHETPLLAAARCNHHQIIWKLLSLPDVDIQMRNKGGKTALHIAASNGSTESCQALLAARDGVHARSIIDETVSLTNSDFEEKEDVSKYSPEATALFFAAAQGHLQTSLYLMDNLASISTGQIFGAIRAGHTNIVQVFLQRNRDIRFDAIHNKSSILYFVAHSGNFSHLPWLPYVDILTDSIYFKQCAIAAGQFHILRLLEEEEHLMLHYQSS